MVKKISRKVCFKILCSFEVFEINYIYSRINTLKRSTFFYVAMPNIHYILNNHSCLRLLIVNKLTSVNLEMKNDNTLR